MKEIEIIKKQTSVSKNQISLEKRIRAFVVKSQGTFTDNEISEFQQLLAKRNINITFDILKLHILKTKKSMQTIFKMTFVCTSGPCVKSEHYEKNLIHLQSQNCPLEIEETICQWGCEQAPVVTVFEKSKWNRIENFRSGKHP